MLPGGLLNTPSWCMVVTSKYGHSSTVSLEVQGWRPIVLKASGCIQLLSFDVLGLLELRESVRDRAAPLHSGLFRGSEALSGSTDLSSLAVPQDQPNPVRPRVRLQASRRM